MTTALEQVRKNLSAQWSISMDPWEMLACLSGHIISNPGTNTYRLAQCAICRIPSYWTRLQPEHQRVIEGSESNAYGCLSQQSLLLLTRDIGSRTTGKGGVPLYPVIIHSEQADWGRLQRTVISLIGKGSTIPKPWVDPVTVCHLLRCVFGDPWVPFWGQHTWKKTCQRCQGSGKILSYKRYVKGAGILDVEEVLEGQKDHPPKVCPDCKGACSSRVRRGYLVNPTVQELALLAHQTGEYGGVFPGLCDALEEAGCPIEGPDGTLLAHLREPGDHHALGCSALDTILGGRIPRDDTNKTNTVLYDLSG